MKFHVSRALVVAISTAAVTGLTYIATHDGQNATIAGALAAAISAGLSYNAPKSVTPQGSN